MQIEQARWTPQAGWSAARPSGGARPSLVLLFGGGSVLGDECLDEVKSRYGADAAIVGCSTAGEISEGSVWDDSAVATAIQWQSGRVEVHCEAVEDADSLAVGEQLGRKLCHADLRHVLVFSDGLAVNGSELAKGLQSVLPRDVAVTGGLAGDGERFKRTLVFANCRPEPDQVAVVGLYGSTLRVGYGSLGGWDPFGPERLVTKSDGNVLYELDGTSALELYKRYLGEHAKGLPATGLLFPLQVRAQGAETGLVRTILSVNEKEDSMTFAGDVPEGQFARLMKANFDRLVDGAHGAASISAKALGSHSAKLALLVSCVGRRMVLQQRTDEEIEAVREVVGPDAVLAGFYSYGEICPTAPNADCELHNQTMTVTTLMEA